jgi:hypothetical protein
MASLGINVISVKVIESDRGYPISVFGTILARDMIDYRCVYLFRREREDPQVIYSKVCTSILSFFLLVYTLFYPNTFILLAINLLCIKRGYAEFYCNIVWSVVQ